jgi:hypothetical protein
VLTEGTTGLHGHGLCGDGIQACHLQSIPQEAAEKLLTPTPPQKEMSRTQRFLEFFFCSVVWTQGLKLARQVLYHKHSLLGEKIILRECVTTDLYLHELLEFALLGGPQTQTKKLPEYVSQASGTYEETHNSSHNSNTHQKGSGLW